MVGQQVLTLLSVVRFHLPLFLVFTRSINFVAIIINFPVPKLVRKSGSIPLIRY